MTRLYPTRGEILTERAIFIAHNTRQRRPFNDCQGNRMLLNLDRMAEKDEDLRSVSAAQGAGRGLLVAYHA